MMIFRFCLGGLSGKGAYIMQFLFGIDAKKEKKKIIIKNRNKIKSQTNQYRSQDAVKCGFLGKN